MPHYKHNSLGLKSIIDFKNSAGGLNKDLAKERKTQYNKARNHQHHSSLENTMHT